MAAAIERVKRKVDAKQYQVFDLYVLKNWPVRRCPRLKHQRRQGLPRQTQDQSFDQKKELTHLQNKRSKPLRTPKQLMNLKYVNFSGSPCHCAIC